MERYPLSGINILVVGGGIGGLFAAVELFRKGHNVRVIEAKEKLDGIGDFVGIGVSATRQFAKWTGMASVYDDICYKPALSMYKYDGEHLGGPWPAKGMAQIPTPVSRPRLQRFLYDYAVSLGIPVTFGKRVLDYFEDLQTSQAGVVTASGEHLKADLVVAADGVGSKSSKVTLGVESKPESSGFAVYRTAFPTRIAHEHSVVAQKFPSLDNGDADVRMYLGPSTHMITVVSKDTTTWLLTHKDKGGAVESWSTRVDPEDVIREIEDDPAWDPNLLALIKQTPKQSIVDWKLMWRNSNPHWTSRGGLVVQLGDAAHSFLPTSANGGTQAVEDGISLASCLHLAGKNNLALATRVHNTLRFQRVSCCQRSGFKNRELWHHTDFDLAKKHPEKLSEMTGRWITDHDPEEYVYQNWAKCVNHLVSGADFENTNIPPGYEYTPWTIDQLLKATDDGRVMQDPGDWS